MKAVPNAHVRSEIKDLDQVRKERQKKADRLSYIKSKGNKGKKSGKTGKRGRSNSKSKWLYYSDLLVRVEGPERRWRGNSLKFWQNAVFVLVLSFSHALMQCILIRLCAMVMKMRRKQVNVYTTPVLSPSWRLLGKNIPYFGLSSTICKHIYTY